MAFLTLDPADIEAGKPVDNDLMTQIKNNEDANNAATAGAVNYDIPNGDMELTDGTFPGNWTLTSYPGGAAGNGLETTAPINGSQSMKFVHPGGGSNGGGYADSDYLPCGYQAPLRLSWLHSATAATMKNQVIVRYFDKAKVTISSDATVYDSIVNPTTATQFSAVCNPPSTARFYKVRLVGGESSVDVAGTALFDAVTVERDRVRSYTMPGAAASVEFLDIRDSKKCRLNWSAVVFSTGSDSLALQVSADNGASWVASGYLVNTAAIGYLPISAIAAGPHFGETTIRDLGEAGYTTLTGSSSQRTSTPAISAAVYNGRGVNTTTAYNAIRVLASAGANLNSGKFTLEELF